MVMIIAEVGVNHDGSIVRAKELAHRAKDAGCDAAKFQMFNASLLAPRGSDKYAMLKALEFSFEQMAEVADYCRALEIEFMATPFDMMSVTALEELGVRRFKIGSGQVKDLAFVKRVGQSGRPVIISNGMCTDDDMGKALANLPDDTTILLCVSLYPTPDDAIQLSEIPRLRQRFRNPVGFSCHSPSMWPSVAAAASGASVIEKHITLSRTAPGPDHSSSIEVGELKHWVKQIRAVML